MLTVTYVNSGITTVCVQMLIMCFAGWRKAYQ